MSEKKYSAATLGPKIESVLDCIIDAAGFDLDFTIEDGLPFDPDFETPDVLVKFTGEDVDLLLRNKAELLLALEHITMESLRMTSEEHALLSFDANDYRLLRIEELRMSAAAAAEKVKHTGQPFQFSPMNSRERRVIHLALRNETSLRSESLGMGPNRMVVVYPAGMPSLPAPQPVFSRPSRSGGPGGPGGGYDRDRRGGPPRRGPRR